MRHGDKYKEMALIKAKNYMPSINIYKKVMDKSLSDINVFFSTEDPDVIKLVCELFRMFSFIYKL